MRDEKGDFVGFDDIDRMSTLEVNDALRAARTTIGEQARLLQRVAAYLRSDLFSAPERGAWRPSRSAAAVRAMTHPPLITFTLALFEAALFLGPIIFVLGLIHG